MFPTQKGTRHQKANSNRYQDKLCFVMENMKAISDNVLLLTKTFVVHLVIRILMM